MLFAAGDAGSRQFRLGECATVPGGRRIVTVGDHSEHLQALVSLCEPADVGELALIRSLLDGNGIPYAVQHEHIGALYPGVALLGSRVMVAERDRQRAEILLSRLALHVREATSEAD
ncbi:MAG: DUF2007 domain-containing protein [Nitrospira sp.]|nr:DUF2007 domain-containing protein [Nitrospira sp.]